MSSRHRISKRDTPRRRKVSLACESCRDKKVRCDGSKPICGPCERRSYPIDRCVYKLENARSASNDEYLKILHNRIRELEEICSQNGVAVPPAPRSVSDGQTRLDDVSEPQSGMDCLSSKSRSSVAVEGLLGLGSPSVAAGPQPSLASLSPGTTLPPLRSLATFQPSLPTSRPSEHDGTTPRSTLGSLDATQLSGNIYRSPSLNQHGNVTAMGAISVAEDEATDSPQEQYYGNSSTASFMRLARESMPIQTHLQALKRMENDAPDASQRDTGLWKDCNVPTLGLQFDDFSLPPRALADHLLECYWERVHCLYPFFHRPSFEQAYENLWGSTKWPKPELPELNIGLGGSYDSGPQSIVFHCALNAIFGLGCHFSDIPVTEREAAVYTFFLRAKRFVGLDLLDCGTIGVVQTLLIIAILLQSTPYPMRCWNSIGLACRVAQGLGLHEESSQRSIKPLEKEIRRRTWHGCVIMDMIVSMTYGRPSMTSHISPVPLPGMRPESREDDPCELSGQPCDHRLGYMTFYTSTIELYKILESILSEIYNAWQSNSRRNRPLSPRGLKHKSLDVIMELDDKLSAYEASIPAVLNWTHPSPPFSASTSQGAIFQRQRNVLRARFIHLRLLLFRPMFTQLCSEERLGPSRHPGQEANKSTARPEKNIIYSSMSVNCAAACVTAAVDLVSLVYETYRTSLTDAWWYNGFYTSTAGFVLIMSYSCRSILDQVDARTVDESWRKCEEVLSIMSLFSVSARNSLQFLKVTHAHIVQNYTARNETAAPLGPNQTQRRTTRQSGLDLSTQSTGNEEQISGETDLNSPINPFMSWEDTGLGLGQEDFGFLGRFDLPDLASWFTDVPDL
ncbi:hypothetical protein N7523_000724 [Penicillium sp. IBT 18751x]|nr:hypothetical protein N7523_000724 [Penicillium sp. IBT 18751x]